jgi:hypothetical protein
MTGAKWGSGDSQVVLHRTVQDPSICVFNPLTWHTALYQFSATFFYPRYTLTCQTHDGTPQNVASRKGGTKLYMIINTCQHINTCPTRMQAYGNKTHMLDKTIWWTSVCVYYLFLLRKIRCCFFTTKRANMQFLINIRGTLVAEHCSRLQPIHARSAKIVSNYQIAVAERLTDG